MTTFEKVKKIVCEKLGVDESKVTEKASFVNDLGADSLDVVEFLCRMHSTPPPFLTASRFPSRLSFSSGNLYISGGGLDSFNQSTHLIPHDSHWHGT